MLFAAFDVELLHWCGVRVQERKECLSSEQKELVSFAQMDVLSLV